MSNSGNGLPGTRRRLTAASGWLDGLRSTWGIHRMLRGEGDRVGLTTVYRILRALDVAGESDTVRTGTGEPDLRAGTTAQHLLVCRECGRTVEVTGPAVGPWTAAIAELHGFSDVVDTLEIFGLCRNCER